jgi:BCD family chlorophyll transporter-like MFS transporter
MNTPARPALSNAWRRLAPRLLPFADAASTELPLSRLLRLSLFQVSVGLATVLLVGTLNRVMILELGVPAWLVALMVSLPLLFAPLRALIGFRSDTHRSMLGWRRVPYLWFGTLLQFGGLAIMPFALIVLSGDTHGPAWIGQAGAALAFLLVGAGLHTTQTAGLALATDIAPPATRPRVVALLYVMLLLGMVVSGFGFSALLSDFSAVRLIQVLQGAALATLVLNVVALWKQERRDPTRTARNAPRPAFGPAWRALMAQGRTRRFLVAVGLGTAGFSMQDIVLEPYGGEILGLSVGATTQLTALAAAGALLAFAAAARCFSRDWDPHRIAALGALVGIVAFAAVIFAAPLQAAWLFRIGCFLIGLGGGLFSVSTLMIAMSLDRVGSSLHTGLAIGAWGAVQASAAGLAIFLGGALRDAVSMLATQGALGPALTEAVVGYSVVYHLELGLLFATLVALGPLVRPWQPLDPDPSPPAGRFGLAEFPG